LPGSLARLTGPCAEEFPGLPEGATAAGGEPGCDVGERRGGDREERARPWQCSAVVQQDRLAEAQQR
jgi:hypothetical protein